MTLKKVYLIVLALTGCLNIVHAQNLVQTVRGKIVDKESQSPVIGANITVDGTNPTIGAVSDQEGNFKIPDVYLGRQNFTVSYMGYEKLTISGVLISSGKEVVLNIELKESAVNLNEVVIKARKNKGEAINSMATLSSRSFNVEETQRYAGGLDDPGRLASAFAGVSTDGNVESNAIMIRGNSPSGVLWQVEGMDVPIPSHFANTDVLGGGAITLFSNQVLSNSDFYTGAFPAEYGNAFAGVFDVHLRNGNNEKYENSFQIGAMGIEASMEGPFRKNGKASFLFNYRYSTLGLLKSFLPEQGLPSYQDLCFKINLPTKNAGVFSIWGIGGIDNYTNKAKTDSSEWTNNHSRMNINSYFYPGSIGLNHKAQLTGNTYVNTSVAFSSYYRNENTDRINEIQTFDPVQRNKYSEYKYSFKSFLNHKFNAKLTNRTGFIYDLYNYNYNLSSAKDENNTMETLQQISTSKGNASLYRLYTQFKYSFSDHVVVNAGIHSMYFGLNDNYAIEPRFGMRWQAAPRHTFSMAYGVHSQMQQLDIYFIEDNRNGMISTPNKELDFSRAQHFVLGYDFAINENLRFKVEPYYQILSNIPVDTSSTSFSMVNLTNAHGFNKVLVSKGSGTNYGIDITLERFLNNGFYYLLTTSLYQSKYKGSDGIERNTVYNNNYVVNILGGKEWLINKSNVNSIFGISGRLYLKGGNRYSPADIDASQQDQRVVYDETMAYTERYPSYYRFDISATYRRNHTGYSTVFAVEINNVLFSPTSYDQVFDYTTNTVVTKKVGRPFPSISYKIEF